MISKILKEDIDFTISTLTNDEKAKLENSTILITGCGGFVGFYLMNFFKENMNILKIKKVIGLDNFILGYPKWLSAFDSDDRFEIKKFDIISDHIENISGANKVDYVIHMASIASPTFYRKYPIETLDANVWGLRSLLEFYKDKSIKGFLFFSSSEVYGNPDEDHIPTSEDYFGYVSFTGPRACYDESKRFGETICMLFNQKYEMPIGVVRPFNNYGPGMRLDDKRVPADFARAVVNSEDIEILSDGSPTRTFAYISDVVSGYLKILLHGSYDYFNIGIDSPEISIFELAKIYEKTGKAVFGYTGKIKYSKPKEENYLKDNPQRRCPDITKARKILGYDPKIYVEEGVERFLKFLKENNGDAYL